MSAAVAGMDRRQVEELVRQALRAQLTARGSGGVGVPDMVKATHSNAGPNPLMVNVSARHMHVTQEDLEVLFGPGSKLTKLKDLYQEGEFASEQVVNIIGPKNRMIPGVRILGGVRKFTQIELSYTDGIFMGIDLPLRISGDIKGSAGCVVVGPHGALNLREGVIRAARHVHMSEADMKHFGVKDGDVMKLRVDGPCGLTFENVKVRYHPKVKLEVHIDTDEGNACHLQTATRMELLK
ncbi:MAG TPA: phosphate propanoyltransferase [Phycisphaerae bacterium]|nr:phosphate propanoyltransferase [Phycisphaerae bacterium]